MKTRVLLIKYFEALNLRPFSQKAERSLQLYPSLALGYLAGVLLKEGFLVSLLDVNALNLSHRATRQRIADSQAELVGITCTTIGWPAALECARLVKQALPEAVVAVGGPQVFLYPKECLSFPCFSLGVLGDGEETLLEIAQKLAGGEKPEGIAGTVERVRGEVRVNPPRAFIQELDALPFPAVSLMPLSRYKCLTIEKPFFTLVTSRGCPYHCAFCSQAFCGGGVRFRSPENVVAEIKEYIEKYRAKELIFFDETFTSNKSRVLKICRLIKENRLKFRFNLRSRVDLIDEEILQALAEAGCYGLHLGVESGDEEILALMKKEINLSQVKAAFKLAKKLGFMTRGYFMLGYLNESRASFAKTLKLALELPLDWASFSLTTPLPGTELYRQVRENGILKSDFWRDYTLSGEKLSPGKENFPHILTPDLTEKDLTLRLKKAYLAFYLRPAFILKKLGGIKNFKALNDLIEGLKIISSI